MATDKTGEEKTTMSFLEHLEILRWHIIRSVISVIVLAIIAFFFKDFIFDSIILAPKSPEFITNKLLCIFGTKMNIPDLCLNTAPFNIININMSGQFSIHLRISMFSGFIAASPYILYELWQFIKPALYKNEKQNVRKAVFYSSFLFILGVMFGYYILAPISVNFFGSYTVSKQIINQINLDSYISVVNSVTLASGIVFELPVLIYLLSKLGIITPGFLRKNRKYAIIIILIVAAIITPPDIFSQILVSLPLIALYEIGISISKKVTEKKEIIAG